MNNILVIGPSYIDETYYVDRLTLDGSSAIINSAKYFGGTGLSLAYYLRQLKNKVSLFSVIGKDFFSKSLKRKLNNLKIQSYLQVCNFPMDICTLYIDKKGEKLCVSNRKITDNISFQFIPKLLAQYNTIIITTISAAKIVSLIKILEKTKYPGKVCLLMNTKNASENKLWKKVGDSALNLYYINMSQNEFQLIQNKEALKRFLYMTVTKGVNGSDIYKNGGLIDTIPAQKLNKKVIFNSNGAGEAYAARFLSNLLEGKNSIDAAIQASKYVPKILTDKNNLLRGCYELF